MISYNKSMNKKNNKQWSIYKVWNEALLEKKDREIKPREKIWASELGKAKVDMYLKLKGVKPTNPPNARSLRKFEAGNIWEWIVKLILTRAGILEGCQKWTMYQYEGMLPVSGRMDFIAGGKPDYEKARKELLELDLPDVFIRAGEKIARHLEKEYPEGLDSKFIEVKSCSSFMFEALEKNSTASKNHMLQLFHYLKSENMKSGVVMYISKDDCRMLEIPVYNPSVLEDEYKTEIKEISEYYYKDEMPPLEKPIVFDEELGRFSKNWKIAYSPYLTKLYGFKNQKEFDDKYTPIVERWKRVITRIKDEKNMTEKNNLVIKEIEDAGYNLEKIKGLTK